MRYQLRLVLDNGRVIRGPIFPKSAYDRFKGIADRLEEYSVLRLSYGSHRIVVPQGMLQRSYAEIRRVGLVRRFIAWWRS